MRTIEQLSHDTYYEMEKYSQYTIDCVQDVESLLDVRISGEYTEQQRNLDFASHAYNISLVLEIINPAFEDDILALRELEGILEDKLANVKF